jgi:hypothetical protein
MLNSDLPERHKLFPSSSVVSTKPRAPRLGLRQDILHHVPMHIGQPEIAPRVVVR